MCDWVRTKHVFVSLGAYQTHVCAYQTCVCQWLPTKHMFVPSYPNAVLILSIMSWCQGKRMPRAA